MRIMTKIFEFILWKQIPKWNTVQIQGSFKFSFERLKFTSQIQLHQDTLTSNLPNFSYMLPVAQESDSYFLSHTFLLPPPCLFLHSLHFLTYEEGERLELAYPNTLPSFRADYRQLGTTCVHDHLIIFSDTTYCSMSQSCNVKNTSCLHIFSKRTQL